MRQINTYSVLLIKNPYFEQIKEELIKIDNLFLYNKSLCFYLRINLNLNVNKIP
jgi:hypothetical protein